MSEPKKAQRFNDGKPPMAWIDADAMTELAHVLAYGVQKGYAPHNWRDGLGFEGVISSMERHIADLKRGKDFDDESKRLVAAHVLANAMFLTHYMLHKEFERFDDRYKKRPL